MPDWNSIAVQLDPNMPKAQYDAIRAQYFYSQVAPTLPRGVSSSAEFQKFLASSDRLDIVPRVATKMALAASAFMEGALPGERTAKIRAMARQGAIRDGILRDSSDQTLAESLGTLGGQGLAVAAAAETANLLPGMAAFGEDVAAAMARGEQAAAVASKVAKGGLAFGTYSALEAKDGDRVNAGVKGALIGAAYELALAPLFGHSEPALKRGVDSTLHPPDPGAIPGWQQNAYWMNGSGFQWTPNEILKGTRVRPPLAALGTSAMPIGPERQLESAFIEQPAIELPPNMEGGVSVLDQSGVGVSDAGRFVYRDPATGRVTRGFMGGELSSALQQAQVSEAKKLGFQISPPEVRPKMNGIIAVLGDGRLRSIGETGEDAFLSEMDTYLRTGGSIDKFYYGPNQASRMNRLMSLLGERAEDESFGSFIKVEKGQWGPVVAALEAQGERVAATPNPEVVEVLPNKKSQIAKAIGAAKAPVRTDFPDEVSQKLYRVGQLRNQVRLSGAGLGDPLPREGHLEMHHLAGDIGQEFNIERSQVGQLALRYFEKAGATFDPLESAKPFVERYAGRGDFPAGERPPEGWKGNRLKGFRSATEEAIANSENSRLIMADGQVRWRPTGVTKIVSPEVLGEGVAGMSIMDDIGVKMEVYPSGPIDRSTLYHEHIHSGMFETGVWEDMLKYVTDPEVKQTAHGLMSRLASQYESYSRDIPRDVLNEAFTHAAEALRFNDLHRLRIMGAWDSGVDGVKQFVKHMAQEMLPATMTVDTVVSRGFQRRLEDLIRRADTMPTPPMNRFAQRVGARGWYDPVSKQWVVKSGDATWQQFHDIHAVWDHFLSHDPRVMLPEQVDGWGE